MKTKPKKLRKIAVIAGSKTDIPAIREGINLLRIAKRQKKIVWEIFDVCSAHRNPKELKKFLREYLRIVGKNQLFVAVLLEILVFEILFEIKQWL